MEKYLSICLYVDPAIKRFLTVYYSIGGSIQEQTGTGTPKEAVFSYVEEDPDF